MSKSFKFAVGFSVIAVVIAAVTMAMLFRYQFTAQTWGYTRFDRLTGSVLTCGQNGCSSAPSKGSAGAMSDADLANMLGQKAKFDVTGARKAGYSDREIIEHIAQSLP